MFARGCLLLILCIGVCGCPSGDSGGSNGPGPEYDLHVKPEGAIVPSEESIKTAKYKPLSRPLFLYVNKAAFKRPEVVAFINYYLSEDARETIATHSVPLSNDQYAEQRERFASALKELGIAADTASYAGEINVDGSSTVGPVTMAVMEGFVGQNRKVHVSVSESGTSGGFKSFCVGNLDICDASRPIAESEKELCQKNNIDYLELTVAMDGITVVVHPDNHWVDGLTIEELKKLWEPNSKVTQWTDLNPKFPPQPIKLYGPDANSGTFEYFTEEVCGKKGATRSDYQQSANDNVLVQGVAGDVYALGYFGFIYFEDNSDSLKALAVAP